VCEPVRRFKFNRNIDPQKAITEGQLAGKRDEFYDLQRGREEAHCSSDTKGRSRDVIALQEVESLFSEEIQKPVSPQHGLQIHLCCRWERPEVYRHGHTLEVSYRKNRGTRIHVLLLLELAPRAASKLWFRSYASIL
jgi:hypothetical protein